MKFSECWEQPARRWQPARASRTSSTLATAIFGKITNADTPRNLQAGLKLVW